MDMVREGREGLLLMGDMTTEAPAPKGEGGNPGHEGLRVTDNERFNLALSNQGMPD